MNRLLQLRLDRGLTLGEVEDGSRVTRQTVAKLELGDTAALAPTLFRLGQFYGVPASTLLGPPVYDQTEREAA